MKNIEQIKCRLSNLPEPYFNAYLQPLFEELDKQEQQIKALQKQNKKLMKKLEKGGSVVLSGSRKS